MNDRSRWDESSQDATSDSQSEESVEILRERQRLAQIDIMDRWMSETLKEQRRTRRWKIFFRLLWLTLLLLLIGGAVLGVLQTEGEGAVAGRAAVVELKGVIDSDSQASGDRMIEGIRQAWQSPAGAVIVRINSPGGSPVQSQRIYSEIRRLEQQGDKPIVAVIEDIGASGAYYVASAADNIYAAPASLVGSIGVIYSGFGLQDAIAKLGVERRVFTAGDNKDFLDPFQPISDHQRQFWQSVLDRTHQQFIAAVKAGRGDRLKTATPELFSGLVWTGERAQQIGLIDGLASVDDVAEQLTGSRQTVDFTPGVDPFEQLSRQLGQVAAHWLGLGELGGSPVRYQTP
ncbi:signal peptide peptidase SppA [Kushneria phosphatilytica]|uniref:Signal peptide peptidase SppA n=1 Tax=Kushneria phosphatilytica TaxID=657387 RepID=A0A1S1NWI8_9GAMM|nr:signal peptide peptidase SppA [Kushneria phosphatilytica]OHV11798.1 S49 family peptidase [Kushneria phosphatilytica]QEL10963.1 signal peptide peptidase SppA [Kushneria phosphatilytica]